MRGKALAVAVVAALLCVFAGSVASRGDPTAFRLRVCRNGVADRLAGRTVCIHVGGKCVAAHNARYRRRGYTCVKGRLRRYAPRAPVPPPAPRSGQQVMTMDLGWAPSSNLPWKDLTQIGLFNLATEAGPNLDASNLAGVNVPDWVATAHRHRGIKALIQIGGEGNDTWGTACGDTYRAQFVRNLINYATSNGFDGVDLDIEDGPWTSAPGTPPNPAMTTCIEAISTAAHAKGLIVSADVITNWEGPWYAPSSAYVDQYQLMTYGDTLAQMQSDVRDTINQGLPASKLIVGVDVDDYGDPPAGGCGQFASYAKHAGLKGSFVWDAVSDTNKAANACADGLAAGSK